jgi:hypothetical protein
VTRACGSTSRTSSQARTGGSGCDAEWIYLRDRDDFDSGLRRLVDALETDLDWRDQHTRLAARAQEWLDKDRNKSFLLRGTDLDDAETWLSDRGGTVSDRRPIRPRTSSRADAPPRGASAHSSAR